MLFERRLIEFDIARDFHLICVDSQTQKSLRVRICLHQGKINIMQNAAHHFSDFEISVCTFFRKSAVDDKNLRVAFFRFADKIKPEFGFHYQNDIRFDFLQSAADGKFPIERKIKNQICIVLKKVFGRVPVRFW